VNSGQTVYSHHIALVLFPQTKSGRPCEVSRSILTSIEYQTERN
jgi:hypothetical protein